MFKNSCRIIFLFIIFVFIFTSCSSNKNSNNGLYSGEEHNSNSTNIKQFVSPFDQYDLSESAVKIISNAEDVLANKCMKKLGFANGNKFPKYGIGNNGNYTADFTNYDRELGPLNIEYAKKFGYLYPGATGEFTNTRADFFDGKEWKESKLVSITELKGNDAKQYDALKNEGGCEDQANKEVTGNLKTDLTKQNTISKLKDDALTTTQDSKTFINLNNSWASCMHKKGFNYKSFKEPLEKYSGFRRSHTISNKEKKMSVADFECKEQTNLINTYRQLLHQNQQNIIDKNIVLFTQMQDYYKQKVERAQKIISENE